MCYYVPFDEGALESGVSPRPRAAREPSYLWAETDQAGLGQYEQGRTGPVHLNWAQNDNVPRRKSKRLFIESKASLKTILISHI